VINHRPKHIYEFGPFRLDAAEHLLLRDGEVVPLQPKAFNRELWMRWRPLLYAMVQESGLTARQYATGTTIPRVYQLQIFSERKPDRIQASIPLRKGLG
jgi:hypothetical protein